MFSWQDLDLNQPLNPAHPLNRGRVAWWLAVPLWYGTNDWPDLVAGYNGVLTSFSSGFGWNTASNPGGAASIRGTASATECITGPSANVLNLGASGTIALWLNATAWATSNYLLSKPAGAGVAATPYLLTYTSSGNLSLSLGNGTTGATATVSKTLATGTWYHLAVTWNGTTTTFYLNGASIGSAAQASFSGYNNTANLQIGNDVPRAAGSAFSFNGYLNDVSLWNRTLSASELSALYWASQEGYADVLNWLSPDAIDVLLSSGGVSAGALLRNVVCRRRFEPAYYE